MLCFIWYMAFCEKPYVLLLVDDSHGQWGTQENGGKKEVFCYHCFKKKSHLRVISAMWLNVLLHPIKRVNKFREVWPIIAGTMWRGSRTVVETVEARLVLCAALAMNSESVTLSRSCIILHWCLLKDEHAVFVHSTPCQWKVRWYLISVASQLPLQPFPTNWGRWGLVKLKKKKNNLLELSQSPEAPIFPNWFRKISFTPLKSTTVSPQGL